MTRNQRKLLREIRRLRRSIRRNRRVLIRLIHDLENGDSF